MDIIFNAFLNPNIFFYQCFECVRESDICASGAIDMFRSSHIVLVFVVKSLPVRVTAQK